MYVCMFGNIHTYMHQYVSQGQKPSQGEGFWVSIAKTLHRERGFEPLGAEHSLPVRGFSKPLSLWWFLFPKMLWPRFQEKCWVFKRRSSVLKCFWSLLQNWFFGGRVALFIPGKVKNTKTLTGRWVWAQISETMLPLKCKNPHRERGFETHT